MKGDNKEKTIEEYNELELKGLLFDLQNEYNQKIQMVQQILIKKQQEDKDDNKN